MTSRSREFRGLRWGLKRGVLIACGFCVWVSLVYAFSHGNVFEREGLSYPRVVLTYLCIGAISGGLVGSMWRLTESTVGVFVVGVIAGIPLALGLEFAYYGDFQTWGPAEWWGVPVFGLLAGLGIGNEIDRARRREGDIRVSEDRSED